MENEKGKKCALIPEVSKIEEFWCQGFHGQTMPKLKALQSGRGTSGRAHAPWSSAAPGFHHATCRHPRSFEDRLGFRMFLKKLVTFFHVFHMFSMFFHVDGGI